MNYGFILLFSCSFSFLKLCNCIYLEFEKSVQPRLGTHYVRDSLRGPPSQKGGQFAEVSQEEGTAVHQTFIKANKDKNNLTAARNFNKNKNQIMIRAVIIVGFLLGFFVFALFLTMFLVWRIISSEK